MVDWRSGRVVLGAVLVPGLLALSLQLARADTPAFEELNSYFPDGPMGDAVDGFLEGRNEAAAEAFEAFTRDHADDPRAQSARFLGLLARHDQGVYDPTAEDLEALARQWPLMADYAYFYGGSAHLKAGRAERAAATLAQVPRTSTLWPRAVSLRARALKAASRPREALGLIEDSLESAPHLRSLWEQKAEMVRDKPALLKEVRLELSSRFPRSAPGRKAAKALGKRARWSADQWLRKADHLFRRHVHKATLKALDGAMGALGKKDPRRCDVHVLRARTLEKMKRREEAWKHFSKALDCEGDALAIATFSGGRNRLRAGKLKEAVELLERHVSTFDQRTTADDATVLLSRALRNQGQHERADGLLLDQLGRWPEGDMVDEATWALVWPRVQSGSWEQVVSMADQVLDRAPRETSYRAEGRVGYWRARALAHLGRQAEAEEGWRRVLSSHPLSWYAILAHARLHQADPEGAKRSLKEAIQRSTPGPDPLSKVPRVAWDDPHFRRGVELLRMGLETAADRELKATQLQPDPQERRSLLWTRAALFHRVGSHDRSVSLSRSMEPHFGASWPVGYHRRLWEIAHPRGFRDLVEGWANKRSIDPHWIWSIIREESGFNPDVESWANAIGLMQIILPTAKSLVRGTDHKPTPDNLRRPEVAIELGSKYLAKLLRQHPVLPLASSGYNAGGGAVKRWRREFGDVELDLFVERIPYREARGYAKRVTRSVARYTWLYGGERMLPLDLSPPGPPESK